MKKENLRKEIELQKLKDEIGRSTDTAEESDDAAKTTDLPSVDNGTKEKPTEEPAKPENKEKKPHEIRFDKLEKEKGKELADACRKIYQSYGTALELGKKYSTEVRVGNRTIKNSCVGFLMTALRNLPYRCNKPVCSGCNQVGYL